MSIDKRIFISIDEWRQMSIDKRIFISIDEWRQMTNKQKSKTLYSLDYEGIKMNNKAFMEHTITLRQLNNYKDILKCANVLDIVERTKDAWFHAKTQIELIDVDKDITDYHLKQEWKKGLQRINKNIEMWENISQLTEDNIPSKEYLDENPFSRLVNSGTVTYLGKSINVTVLKTINYDSNQLLRIEKYKTFKMKN
jgi:hypothetical protein